MALPAWFQALCRRYGVVYQELQHLPVFSASHLARAEGVSGYHVAKPVFLSASGRPVSVILPAPRRVDIERAEAVMGEKLKLATAEEIAGWFPVCPPASLPPLRLRPDQTVLMDRSLARLGDIVFPAGTPEHAVAVRFRDWYRLVRPGVGRFAASQKDEDTPPPATVLIVEDEEGTNQFFCQLLKMAGFNAHGVCGGREAVVWASETRPAAILLDLMLPDMTGFEVFERLRRTGPLRGAVVMVVTALDDDESRERGRRLGADAYLTKPVEPEKLISELQRLLEHATA